MKRAKKELPCLAMCETDAAERFFYGASGMYLDTVRDRINGMDAMIEPRGESWLSRRKV